MEPAMMAAFAYFIKGRPDGSGILMEPQEEST